MHCTPSVACSSSATASSSSFLMKVFLEHRQQTQPLCSSASHYVIHLLPKFWSLSWADNWIHLFCGKWGCAACHVQVKQLEELWEAELAQSMRLGWEGSPTTTHSAGTKKEQWWSFCSLLVLSSKPKWLNMLSGSLDSFARGAEEPKKLLLIVKDLMPELLGESVHLWMPCHLK